MTITELLPKLTEEDKKFLEQNAKSEKDFYDYFVSKGLTDSFEEFTEFLNQIKKLSDGEKELNDNDLEKIAGGSSSGGELMPTTVPGPGGFPNPYIEEEKRLQEFLSSQSIFMT